MPRTSALPKYRLYIPKNLAVVRIDGKDHYLGRHGSPESWERYHRLLAERAAACGPVPTVSSPTPTADGPGEVRATPSVAEMILAFWTHARSHYRHADGTPTNELENLKAALRPLRKLYGTTLAGEFGPLALRAVRDEMVRAGLARSSINDRINRVRRAFKWAASVELIPASVVAALATVAGLQKGRTSARETEPVGPVAREIVEATLPHLSRPVAGLVRLQLLTGMRPGEACALRGRDLVRGEPTWTYAPADHKTAHRGKRRTIPLGPRAMALVEEYQRADPDAYLFDPRKAVAANHAARSDGRKSRPTPSEMARRAASPGAGHSPRYSTSSYAFAIKRACDRAFPHPTLAKVRANDLDADQAAELRAWRKAHRWHPNQLRHAAATAIRARYGLEAAQAILGHARADVSQVYAERDVAKAREVMREIG